MGSEKAIENKLRKATKDMGGIALKFISPGMSGVPDRLILFPGKRLAFVEVKAPRMQMRPLQVKRKRQLEALGFSVYCIDHPDQIGGVLDEIRAL
ncbi:MAG TPA: VRR-NUC domain-containing protein [Clostridia bacterium]|nr:VRR-NUC domain-containing protein [Clostridia bacterium]